MKAHVLLNLYKQVWLKGLKCEALSLFRSKFNKFNNTGA